MKVVVTKFKDGSFCVSDGDSMINVSLASEASLWASWKLKKGFSEIKSHVDSLNHYDMVELTDDGKVSFAKIDYSEMFG